jgi:hypothetical protein
MKPNDAIMVALLVVLVVVVIHYGQSNRSGFAALPPGGAYATTGHQAYDPGSYNPYTVLNKQIGLLRGAKHDAYGQPPLWEQPHGLDRYHRSGASIKPEMIAAAERDAWFTPDTPEEGGASEGFDPGDTGMMATSATTADPSRSSDPKPSMDYGGYIADLIVDPRTRDNHAKWVEEMGPWSGGPMIVDNMDEAMEATTHFVGLRRPQPVAQYNPLQLTERDTMTFISNNKFNFRG